MYQSSRIAHQRQQEPRQQQQRPLLQETHNETNTVNRSSRQQPQNFHQVRRYNMS